MVPRNIVAAVGPPNALFSRISFIQPNEGWLSAKRSKVVEADLLNVVEERMPDLLLSEEPRALGSAEGDIKVSCSMDKHSSVCTYFLRPRQGSGTSEGKPVLRSKLTVRTRRRETRKLAQYSKNTQKPENSSQLPISSYFRPVAGRRLKTADDEATLKLLEGSRETEKWHLSGLNVEKNSGREIDVKRKRRDAYVPSCTGPSSATRSSHDRNEGNIPKAITQTLPDTASSMEEEIRNARVVKDLTEEHIRYLFEKISPTLDKIINREVASWRLKVYIRGGKEKRLLTHKVFIHQFSDEQIDLVINLFVNEFGGRRRMCGDVINQVVIPEFLIRVFMANQGTTYEESEELMKNNVEMPRTCSLLNAPSLKYLFC